MNKGGFCRRLLVHLAAIVNRPQHYSLLSYCYPYVTSQSFQFYALCGWGCKYIADMQMSECVFELWLIHIIRCIYK